MEQNGKCCNQSSKLILMTLALMSTLFLAGIYMKVSIFLDLYTSLVRYSQAGGMGAYGCPYTGHKKWHGKMEDMKGSMGEMQQMPESMPEQGPIEEMQGIPPVEGQPAQ